MRTTGVLGAMALALTLLAVTPADAAEISFAAPAAPTGGVVAVPVGEAGVGAGPAAAVDAATGGALARALAASGFAGREGASQTFYALGPFERVVVVGTGAGELDARRLADLGGTTIQALSGVAAAELHLEGLATSVPDAAAHVALGVELGSYQFNAYRAGEVPADTRLTVRTADAPAVTARFTRDLAGLASSVTFARDLIGEPANTIYPETFVERTRTAFRGLPNVRFEVLDERRIAALGMGALQGVGQGSARPPRLLLVHYTGDAGGAAPVAFVGKGITFDTGGISLKDAAGMWRMKYDMSGAAISVAAVRALAARGARVNAIGVAALAENMPSGSAMRPGDIVRTMSGKTVEVINTDAEGRLVLADALTYVQRTYRPRAVINIATLTGAIRTALGDDYAGLYGNDDALAAAVTRAGEATGELVWRMPLHPSLREEVKSKFADLTNAVEGGLGGANFAAQFIAEFIEPETRWAHLDIASTAWGARGPTVPTDAVAFGVRLFDELVRAEFERR
jgi:leucyl aminopeptidase